MANNVQALDAEIAQLDELIAEDQARRDKVTRDLMAQANTSDALKRLGDVDQSIARRTAERAALAGARGEIVTRLQGPARNAQRATARKQAPEFAPKRERQAVDRARRLDELLQEVANELQLALIEGQQAGQEAVVLAKAAILSDEDRQRATPVLVHYAGAMAYLVEPLAWFLANAVPRELAAKVYSLSTGWNFDHRQPLRFESAALRASRDLASHVASNIAGALDAEEKAIAEFGRFKGSKA